MIAARELDLDGLDNRNWVNDHTVYTHGYGVVAAYGNKVTADGQPKFFRSRASPPKASSPIPKSTSRASTSLRTPPNIRS